MKVGLWLAALAAAGIGVSWPGGSAEAAGFHLRDNSKSALITAHAGATAFGFDPTHQLYNPATLSHLSGVQLTVDAKVFIPEASIEVWQATAPLFLGGADLTPLGGSGNLADPALAPTGAASWQIDDRFSVGFAVSAPFAVAIEAPQNWAGQYQLLKTDMRALSGQLAGSVRVSEWLAIGAGLILQHFNADLRRLEFLGAFSAPGFVKGDHLGVGYHLGVVVSPTARTHVGFSYRSSVDHHLKGTAGAIGVPAFAARTTLTTPDMATIGLAYAVTDRLTLLTDIGWTGWSRFTGFAIELQGAPNEIRAQDWRDTWHAAFGFRYMVRETLTVGAGILLDQGASKDTTNAFSPDANRLQIAAGVEKRLSHRAKVALAVSHMMLGDAQINVTEMNLGGNFGNTLIATFESGVTMVGLSATLNW